MRNAHTHTHTRALSINSTRRRTIEIPIEKRLYSIDTSIIGSVFVIRLAKSYGWRYPKVSYKNNTTSFAMLLYIYKSVAVRSYNYNKIINIVTRQQSIGKLRLSLVPKRKECDLFSMFSSACTRKKKRKNYIILLVKSTVKSNND